MLDPIQKELVKKLTWAQFVDFLKALEIDVAQFPRNVSPAEHALLLDDQIKLVAGNREEDEEETRQWLKGAFQQVLGMGAGIETGTIKVREGISEISSRLGDVSTRDDLIATLAPDRVFLEGLRNGITAMSSCKEAHEALHNLSMMIPALLEKAEQWLEVSADEPEKGPRTLELHRTSGGIEHNIRRFSETVSKLPPPSNEIFGNTAEALEEGLNFVKGATDDPAAGDPLTPIHSFILPNIRQMPSELQNLIAQQAAGLPFEQVIDTFRKCQFAAKDETVVAMTTLHEDTSAIEKQHHDWQFIDNQIRLMELPVDNLDQSPIYTKQISLMLKHLQTRLEDACGQDPQNEINQKILQFAEAVTTLLADEATPTWQIQSKFLDLKNHISQRFYATDNNLLTACRDMEPLCDPLLHLVNAL